MNTSNRISYIDALRGFSLFGLLLVHIPLFAFAEDILFSRHPDQIQIWEGIARVIYNGVCDGKFFPIFSFLFGIGFAIQIQGNSAKNPKLFQFRLLGLALIGILHTFLFFNGDILFSYSILGLILFFLRNKNEVVFLKLASLGIFISSITYLCIGIYFNKEIDFTSMSELTRISNSGNFFDMLQYHKNHLLTDFGFILLFNWPSAFAMLCLGYWVGRKNIHLKENPFLLIPKNKLNFIFLIGFIGSVPLAISVWGFVPESIGMFTLGATAPFLSLMYLYLFYHFYRKYETNIIFKLFQNAGKMSLTIYLSESILMSFFFQGWGLGQFEKWSYETSMLLSIPFYLILSSFATLWFQYFSKGPMEFLLQKFIMICAGQSKGTT
jgi:uncharacterized protein